jgi:hypothetical protein
MRVTRMLAAAAAISLALTPAVASSMNPAADLSLDPATGAPAAKSHTATYLLLGAGVVAVVVAAVAMGHNDNTPASA